MSAKTVPICDDCWRRHWQDRDPIRLRQRTQETCDLCRKQTMSGIYVRRDSDKSFRMGDDNKVPESACPSCGYMMDAASCVSRENDGRPEPGDITVCIRCGHIMAFADDLTLRDLTDEEAKAVAGDQRLLAIQKARGEVMKESKQ